MKSMNMHSQSR